MRELDVLLTRYLDQAFEAANDEQKDAFRRLLTLPDPVIYGYLLGRDAPPDASLRALVDAILTLGEVGAGR